MCIRRFRDSIRFMPNVLVLLAAGFEEIEAITPIDILRRAGVEVIVAALVDGIPVTGRSGITVHTDTTVSSIETRLFDAIFLPGGPGVKHLRADPRVRGILERHVAAGRWITAICAAPTVLQDAGLLQGRRFTAHPSVANELPDIIATERVIIDGRLITSRGAGTALDFALQLVDRLVSPEKAAEVAASICA